MSHLTAAETLDSGEVASLPKRWAISLSGGERCSRKRILEATMYRILEVIMYK